MSTPYTVLTGRLTADPELRFTPSGKAVANFTVACSDRKKNDSTNEWEDGDKAFIRCSVWEVTAEHVAESLTKGAEVVVVGNLVQREFDTKEGEKRTVVEMRVKHVAAEITRFASVQVKKLERVGAGAASPWDAPPAGSTFSDNPPF